MLRLDLRWRRVLLWLLVIWVCLSFFAIGEVAYYVLPSHTSRWGGLRRVVLEADAGYSQVSMGGVPPFTEKLNFSAEGTSGNVRFNDFFSVWEGQANPMDFPSDPSDDSRETVRTISVGDYHVRVVLSHDVSSPDSAETAKALAESRRRALEPAIRRYLVKPARIPSLRLIRNDLKNLIDYTSGPVPTPFESYLVPIYFSVSIGRIPSFLFGLVVLVVPFGDWSVYGSIAVLAAVLVGSAVLTEIKWRRGKRDQR